MEKKIFAFLMAMLILLMTNHIWAEEKREEKAVTLEEIVVTASRIEEPVKEVASSITVIIQKRRSSGKWLILLWSILMRLAWASMGNGNGSM